MQHQTNQPAPQPAPLANAWFILGHEPLLSAAEIFSFLKESRAFNYDREILKINGPVEPEIINSLGGTIKIGTELASDLSESGLIELIANDLERTSGKINFGISCYSGLNKKIVEDWGKRIKRILKERGRSVRYVYKNDAVLSSVTVEKNSLVEKGGEFLVKKTGDKFSVAKTIAVQPFQSFSERDYGRPGRDDLSGMLPPKLAIMMINLLRADLKKSVILDPFCGSGTIISEAALLGFKNVFGSDISEKAVADSGNNIKWITEKYAFKASECDVVLKQADATKLSSAFQQKFDGIVAEPYLGIPRRGKEAGDFLEKQAGELKNLYLGAFSEFKKILNQNGTVVFVIPRFYLNDSEFISISNTLVPDLSKIGFKADPLLPRSLTKDSFVLYRRTGQLVGREVWRFKM